MTYKNETVDEWLDVYVKPINYLINRGKSNSLSPNYPNWKYVANKISKVI